MSDDEKVGSEKKGRGTERDRAMVEPVVVDEAFFMWLDRLFNEPPAEGQFPERLEVRIVIGKQRKYGPLLENIPFAPVNASAEAIKKGAGTGKPDKEKLVELSNRILHSIQRDCDETRKPTVYGIFAWHFRRGDEPYSQFLRRCEPKGRYSKNNGAEDEDDEDKSLERRFSTQILRHQETMFGLAGAAMEGMYDRQDRTIARLLDRNERLEGRVEKLVDMLERALNMEAERHERLEWAKVKVEGVRKGLDFAIQMAPPLLNQLAGKQIVPTSDTHETITLRNFFRTVEEGGAMTKEQAYAAFGEYDETPDRNLIKPGVLTPVQGEILVRVALGQMAPDELDKLMPDGPHQVTGEQAVRLQQIFSLEQIAPLMLIFESRRNKKAGG